MIEQIINWWNSLEPIDIVILGCASFVILGGLIVVYIEDIIEKTKNKRKTTTQKYREGLIKK